MRGEGHNLHRPVVRAVDTDTELRTVVDGRPRDDVDNVIVEGAANDWVALRVCAPDVKGFITTRYSFITTRYNCDAPPKWRKVFVV